jgi:hypothetical protein
MWEAPVADRRHDRAASADRERSRRGYCGATANGDKVAYAVLSFCGSSARAPTCFRCRGYELDDDEELKRAPSFRADKDFDWGDRAQEAELHRYYGHALPGRILIGSCVPFSKQWNACCRRGFSRHRFLT